MKRNSNLTLSEVLNGSVFQKVCAILRENDYSYTHDDDCGYDNFSPSDIKIITESLMQESDIEREYAQDYINFYNALMQYSNFMADSAAKYDKEYEKLGLMIDTYEMLQQISGDLNAATKKGFLKINSDFVVRWCLEHTQAGGTFFCQQNEGKFELDVNEDGNFLEVLYKQSARAAHALAVLKAWVETGRDLVGRDIKHPINQLVPFNFVSYLSPTPPRVFPSKYYISSESGRDSSKEEEKFKVFPEYKFTIKDPDGEKTANSILNITLQQWQLDREKIAEIKKRLKKV